jgi:hypothetical protein
MLALLNIRMQIYLATLSRHSFLSLFQKRKRLFNIYDTTTGLELGLIARKELNFRVKSCCKITADVIS